LSCELTSGSGPALFAQPARFITAVSPDTRVAGSA
jgi:hypothetical protein